jgi:ABC-2 type transport system permease protein
VFTEIVVTTCGVLTLHGIATLAMWLGANITGAPLHFADALGGALNSAPVALLALGAAALAVGWLPSAVGAIGALPVVGGFLINVASQSTHAPRWVVDLSPWAHIAAVPDTPPNWPATTAFALIAATLIALGVAGYCRRDLST